MDGSAPSNFADRLAMVRLAVEGDPRLAPSLIDAPRADGRLNYTFDTLVELKRNLASEDTLFFLTGADSFLTLKKWHRAAELLLLSDFIVAGRPGFSLEDAAAALPRGVRPIDDGPHEGPGYLMLAVTNHAGERRVVYLLPDL